MAAKFRLCVQDNQWKFYLIIYIFYSDFVDRFYSEIFSDQL